VVGDHTCRKCPALHPSGIAPDGGTIEVRVAFDSARSQVTIEVHDDGLAFRPIRRAAVQTRWPGRPGRGLALLLMSDICAAHGGTVDVRSSTNPSDHGTTIRLTLPSGDLKPR